MLIGFFGPPCSGKTTLAHALFAAIKAKGYQGEFVSEYARRYIAKNKLEIQQQGMMLNTDQANIMDGQKQEERWFDGENTIVVTDTCSANTCFYAEELLKE